MVLLERNEPFIVVYNSCREADDLDFKFFHSTIQYDDNINPLEKIINLVTNRPEDARKYHAYKPVLNPSPSVNNIYSDDIYIHIIPGHTYGVTRVRLMSHDLKIETCSWSRILRDL